MNPKLLAMLDSTDPLAELLRRDHRYHVDSYDFVFSALRYAQEHLNLGREVPSVEAAEGEEEAPGEDEVQRHVTGQELCEAIRQYALSEYGLLAKSVLSHWGVESTGDFGEIVFNLIDVGRMRKSEHDRREDFADVFDFETGLTDKTVFVVEDPSEGRPS